MGRTIVVQLNPTPEQARSLKTTLEQYTVCFHTVAQEGFTTDCSNGVELQKRTYYPLRAQYPDLPAQLVCSARVKATEAVTSAFTWKIKKAKAYLKRVEQARKQGKPPPVFKPVRCPGSDMGCIRYDQRSYWVNWETFSWSLSTVNGRVVLPFKVPASFRQSSGHQVCSADLSSRHGRFPLHLAVSLPEPVFVPSQEVIGVDLGLNRPAVTSQKQCLGEKRWKEQDRRIVRLRRALQAKGTRSAKRHLKKLSKKLFRLHRDHDHVLSKRLVQQALPGSTIVLENLTTIRETARMGRGQQNKNVETKRRLHSWSVAQLYSFIEDKAQARGIAVVRIDPRHPSQTCSKCGSHHRLHRQSQSLFLCRRCGYQLNADLNAALTLREKYLSSLAQDGTSVLSGPTRQAAYRVRRSRARCKPLPLGMGFT